jgi:hypothetical protein
VWTPDDPGSKTQFERFPQDFWLKRGIVPLRWRGGKCNKQNTEDQFVENWSSAQKRGYRGIAIDEFGSGDAAVDSKMARALVRTKNQCPNLFIAAWQAGRLNEALARGFRDAADLVILEAYAGPSGFEPYFTDKVEQARRAGIIDKTILAIGINDADPKYQKRWRPWANTPEGVRAQIGWIRRNAAPMPGIAFYANHASRKLVQLADDLCGPGDPNNRQSPSTGQ